MTREELFQLHRDTCSFCLGVMKDKNRDYTGDKGVFDNFKASNILSIHPVKGILLRCLDKFKRIETHVDKGSLVVEGEGVLDSIDDVINYMILCKGMIIEEQDTKVEVGVPSGHSRGIGNEQNTKVEVEIPSGHRRGIDNRYG